MRINQRLLWGSSIEDPGSLQADLYAGRISDRYYAVIYTGKAGLEICSWRMIHHNPRLFEDSDRIIGIAVSREEAYALIMEIMDQVYALRRYDSVSRFLKDQLGVEP